jgi:hypothetical protein
MIGFTANLPREIPCEDIESQVAEKVSGNCCGKVRPESTGDRPRGAQESSTAEAGGDQSQVVSLASVGGYPPNLSRSSHWMASR